MNNNSKLTVNFRPKKQSKGAHSYIYARVRLNGEDGTDFSTFVKSNEQWDQENQIFRSKDPLSIEANERLNEIRVDLNILYRQLKRTSEPTVHDLRNKYVRQAERKTLTQIYKDHFNNVCKKVGQPGFSKGTKKGHNSHNSIINAFLKHKKRTDIDLIDIRKSFGEEFVNFMRDNRKYSQNYIVRNLNHLKRLLDKAQVDGYITTNPIKEIKETKEQPGEIVYLSESEIESISNCQLFNRHLQRVADAFLFQCYTGLAYCDLKRFNPDAHLKTLNERPIIQYCRQKGSAPFTIPFLPQAKRLLEKYNGNIPIVSNQKMNDYLKDIAKTVGISARLTTHIGRKTAGTYLLNHRVPLEVVSKILGHKSIRTTEKIYAVLLQVGISEKLTT